MAAAGAHGAAQPPDLRLMRYTASDTLSGAPVMLMVRSVLPHSRSFSSQLLMRIVAPLICLWTHRKTAVTPPAERWLWRRRASPGVDEVLGQRHLVGSALDGDDAVLVSRVLGGVVKL